MQVFALVDYDNVKPVQREVAEVDVEANLRRIAEHATSIAKANYPSAKDLELRLYGGWTDKRQGRTATCLWLERVLGSVRSRINGVRVTAEVVLSNYESAHFQLVGLYRDGGQKMVDTLIVSDLITLTSQFNCPVLLLSDDDDMVPGLVAARAAKRNVTLVRKRAMGEGMNDHVISSLNLQLSGGVA